MIFNLETLEQILKTHREERLDKPTQSAIARELKRQFGEELKISQSRLSEMESGMVPFRVLFVAPQHRLAALKLYGFSDSEIRKLDDRFELAVGPYLTPTIGLTAPAADELDHVGTVSAGNGGSGILVKQRSVSAPSWVAEKRLDPANIFVAEVDGDSMTCEVVARTIPQGARAYFHRPNEKVQPTPGRIVYVYLQAEDTAVLKIFEPGTQFTILRSSNPSVPPLIVDESNPGVVQGIYLAHEVLSEELR